MHGDPDCLCDVTVLDRAPSVTTLPEGYDSLDELLQDAETFLTNVEARAAEERIRKAISFRRPQDGKSTNHTPKHPDGYLSGKQGSLYRALWDEGMTTYEIADRLQKAPYDIYEAAIRGFKQAWTSPMLHVEQLAITGATLDDMYAAGKPVTKFAIQAHIRRLGIVPPAGRMEQAVIRSTQLVAAGENKWRASQLAAIEFDVNVATVYSRLTGSRGAKVG